MNRTHVRIAIVGVATTLPPLMECAAAADETHRPSQGWVLHNEAPAGTWEDAFVTGNGRLGTMVRGTPGREVITCVHEELFIRGWDRRLKSVPDIAHMLPDVRKAIADGNPAKGVRAAVDEARRQLVKLGAHQAWTLMPHPAFDLLMDVETQGDPMGYQRSLNLETGEALVTWQDEAGVVKEQVFTILIELGSRFDLDAGSMGKWESMLAKLPEYRINEDGALAEWIPERYPDNYKHRHNSHLYPVYPGWEFLLPEANPRFHKAAEVALAKRFETDTDSAHGLVHVGLMATRLQDKDKVFSSLDRLSRRSFYYASFVSAHYPNRRIYNLDASLSLPRLIMEMLLFSLPGRIELLPAWPEGFGQNGSIRGVLARGGFAVDIGWENGALSTAVIHSRKGGQCEVTYREKTATLNTMDGQSYQLNEELEIVRPLKN